jgi:hypothetical protein
MVYFEFANLSKEARCLIQENNQVQTEFQQ